jgi:DNA mismatch repair ATPase MutS
MSKVVDLISPNSLLLCNESFASTNEREGSQIARTIIDAFIGVGIKVVFVTHLYDLAHSLHARHNPNYLFLRAQRRDDGVRTFRLIEAEPQPTSYGQDSFRRVFGVAGPATSAARWRQEWRTARRGSCTLKAAISMTATRAKGSARTHDIQWLRSCPATE